MALAKIGCRGLTLCGRNEANLTTIVNQCTTTANGSKLTPDQVLAVVGDVTDPEYCRQVIAKTIDKFDRLDVLVNNAGVGNDCSLLECDMKLYDLMFDCHVRAAVMLTHNAAPHLIKFKGCVVNISSISAVLPMKGELFYAMSKAALDSFTKCTAAELGPHGVRVNSVNPGVTKTNFHERAGYTKEKFERYCQYENNATPLGRHGEVDDVTPAILFLASDAARYVTGVCLVVDGGRTCLTPKYRE
jgi:NAD(P)-dependent dehydrogenase (short-subunit alcohol dehydrogenase family)